MYKYAIISLVTAVIYFVFLKDPYPSTIEFLNYTLSSKEDNNNTVDNKVDIFSYRDKMNHHILLFAIMNDSEFTISDFSKQYLGRFQYQGVKFQHDGSRHLGIKNDEAIYITKGNNLDALIVYVEKGVLPMPRQPSDGEKIFSALESFSF